jgi:hypothetical protein
MPAGTWSSSTGDWIVLRITPMPAPTGLTNGFAAGPETVDVTARWHSRAPRCTSSATRSRS